jgi:hypothetical protein
MLGPKLQEVAEFDVETARDQARGGLEEVTPGNSGQRLLTEMGDCLLLPRRCTELLLRATRFLYPQPAESLGGQPGPLRTGYEARFARPPNP